MPMASQGSADSTFTTASFLGPFAGSPGTPIAAGDAAAAATPDGLLPSPVGHDSPSLASEGGMPWPGARRRSALPAGQHMLPLQHLLMSERAHQLSALEVKAIVYKARRQGGAGRLGVLGAAIHSPPCAACGQAGRGWIFSNAQGPDVGAHTWMTGPGAASRVVLSRAAAAKWASHGAAACRCSCCVCPPAAACRPRHPRHQFEARSATLVQVAADLAALHDAGILHRHVTVASVALARSGNLATARLMGHPYNVAAGQGWARGSRQGWKPAYGPSPPALPNY